MSQTEAFMVLALGSALTFVFFLLFGRIYWSLAMKAAARRRASELPIEIINLNAEQDRLRAEHAMATNKLESSLSDIKARLAEKEADLSRKQNLIQTMEQNAESREQDIKAQLSATDNLIAQINNKDVEIAGHLSANYNLVSQLQTKDSEIASHLSDKDNLISQLQAKDVEIARHMDTNENLVARLHAKDAEIAGYMAANDSLVTQLHIKDAEIKAQMSINESLLNQINIKDMELDAGRRSIAEMTDNVARQNLELTSMKDVLQKQRTALRHKQTHPRTEDLLQDIRLKDEHIKSLQSEVDTLTYQLESKDAAMPQHLVDSKQAKATRETREFQKQLRTLDELFSKTVATSAAPKKSSLAQRFLGINHNHE